MTPAFLKYIPWLLPEEGAALENVPGDSGGLTKFGVDAKDHPGVDIAHLTRDQATAIYWSEWLKAGVEFLPPALAWATFDEIVNGGPAIATLQAALNLQSRLPLNGDTIAVDGRLGPQTIAAAHQANLLEVVGKMLEIRTNRYLHLPDKNPVLAKFEPGWLNRIADLRSFILKASTGEQEVS